MSSTKTVYLNLREMTEVYEKDVFLKDIADVYCSDAAIKNKCLSLKVKTIRGGKACRFVGNALAVIEQLESQDSRIQVSNVGKVDFVVNYKPPKPPGLIWQWSKTIFVCILCFCGAAFAIMTFNNDVNVQDVFSEVYYLVMGRESDGFTVLEVSYSFGLALGIILFFNHFAGWKVSADPTPLEVEMRMYDENIGKTVIQNSGRKEQDVDVR